MSNCLTVFQNLFPARGRKRYWILLVLRHPYFSFSEPIPRKGTETWGGFTQIAPKIAISTFFRTYSPQGDGNSGDETWYPTSLTSLLFFRTYSPQGDGNSRGEVATNEAMTSLVFQNLFPARGRKPDLISSICESNALGFFRTYSPQGDGNAAMSSAPQLVDIL